MTRLGAATYNNRCENQLALFLATIGIAACLFLCGCNRNAKPASDSNSSQSPHASAAEVSNSSPPRTEKVSSRTPTASKPKFRAYDVVDARQGGMVVSRLAVPGDWKAASRVVWNYNDFYMPVHVSARVQAPDNSSWIEFYPAEFFLWLDPAHDRAPQGRGGIGGIHHTNIKLPEAMVRYVIGPNRRNARHLRILGYRPVNNLPKAFPKMFADGAPKGEGVCMRVQYELDGKQVDEEFYGFMTRLETIPSPNGRIMEYHRVLLMAHSLGAASGKLESARPVLGFIATSLDPNPGWQKRFAEVKQMQGAYYQRAMKANYAEIQAAGQRSRQLTAQSDAFLRQIDANLAQSRAQQKAQSYSSSSNDEFNKRADDFDQNIRGTEHMQDQYGQVSDQYTDYNYHWTDGYGRFVHTDDPNFDPNKYLTGDYQQMTPGPR